MNRITDHARVLGPPSEFWLRDRRHQRDIVFQGWMVSGNLGGFDEEFRPKRACHVYVATTDEIIITLGTDNADKDLGTRFVDVAWRRERLMPDSVSGERDIDDHAHLIRGALSSARDVLIAAKMGVL